MEAALGEPFFAAIHDAVMAARPLSHPPDQEVVVTTTARLPIRDFDGFFRELHTTTTAQINDMCAHQVSIQGYTQVHLSLVNLTTGLPTNLFINLKDHYDLFLIYLLYPPLWPVVALEWFRYRRLKKKGTLDVTVHCVLIKD